MRWRLSALTIAAAEGRCFACDRIGDQGITGAAVPDGRYTPKAVARSRFGSEGCEAEGRQLGVRTLGRLAARSDGRDKSTIWQTRQARYDAVCAWGIPELGLLQRVGALGRPVFVADGDGDQVILSHYSCLLAGLIPQAYVKHYPDSAHGFLVKHHTEFAGDVETSLSAPPAHRCFSYES